MGQNVHAVRRLRRLLPARPALGALAAEALHDDPRRQARGSADFRLDVDVHLLLQLHRPLPAQAADHPHHARLAPKGQPTREIATIFWKNLVKTGRVNELKFSLAMYFKDGFVQGVRNAMAMQGIGFGLMKARRLSPLELLGGHSCKDRAGIKRMIAKAQQIENRKKGFAAA